MEGSTVAVFQVRKINKVSFGSRRKKINNNLAAAPLNLALIFFPTFHHSDPYVGSPFFFHSCPSLTCASQQVSGTAGSAPKKVRGDSF